MLIYNFQKEFLGIDDKDLHTLGFNTLEELRSEVTDFADLFVKTPGYVHNFQHVHWIDFIQYADDSEESKVLINIKGKTFKATLAISTLYLIDNPSAPAYMIRLNNLHPLSQTENENLSHEILNRELPKVEPQEAKVFTKSTTPDAYDIPQPTPVQQHTQTVQNAVENDLLDIDMSTPSSFIQESQPTQYTTPSVPSQKVVEDEMLSIEGLSLDVFNDEEIETPATQLVEDSKEETQQTIIPQTNQKKIEKEWDNGYQYDPNIASKELGLPIDLIEEFIQDFIIQAKEFKDEIYISINNGDVENVKVLSHKLKGVAANLRIEDAHEVLSAVSATNEMDVIHENLDIFYKIIAKLAGEPVTEIVTTITPTIEESYLQEEEKNESLELEFKDDKDEEDNLIQLDFKEEETTQPVLKIEDDDVPDKIEIPELADDDFFEINIDNDIQKEAETPSFTYSKEEVAQEIGLDQESFNELFEDFVAESQTIFENINTAVHNNDFERCRDEAIKFKGMSDNMRIHEFTHELEILIHSADKDAILQAIQKIDTTLTKISEMGA